jgi:hypothetical protein
MKATTCNKFFFATLCLIICCIKPSSIPHYYLIKVENKTIPSLVAWPKIKKFTRPFKEDATLVTDRRLYKKFILPFEAYLDLTERPILFFQTQYHNTDGNAYAYFQSDTKISHSILIPAPAYKYIATILHELVHIYIATKRTTLYPSFQEKIFYHESYAVSLTISSLAYLLFINDTYAFLSNTNCFIQLWFTLTGKNRWNQLEEIICDSYAGIIFADKAKNLNLIENDIHYFKNEIMQYPEKNSPFTNFIQDVCCFSTYPSSQKRLKHLLAMKQLVNENKTSQIHQWIKEQEDVLFKSKTFFQLGLVPHL